MSEKVCLKSRMQQMQVNRAPPALCLLTLSVVQEEKTEGRGRRKRKLSTHKVAAVKESGDEKDEMESKEQPSAEVNTTLFTSKGHKQTVLADDFNCFFVLFQETDQEKVAAVRTPRRGRSSRTSEESEKEPEKLEETPSRGGRRSGAAAKGAAAGNTVYCYSLKNDCDLLG